MLGDPSVWAGAALGISGTLVLLFGLVGVVDARFVTRREYDATMKDIQRQLTAIAHQVGAED